MMPFQISFLQLRSIKQPMDLHRGPGHEYLVSVNCFKCIAIIYSTADDFDWRIPRFAAKRRACTNRIRRGAEGDCNLAQPVFGVLERGRDSAVYRLLPLEAGAL